MRARADTDRPEVDDPEIAAERDPRPRFSLQRSDASEWIALELRRYLERNHLQPGDRVGTEAQLAEEFGVSRSTLREALRLLAGSHLIHTSPGRRGGVYVVHTPNEGMARGLSASVATMLAAGSVSLDELLEVRLFMEPMLAGLAAVNADGDRVAELEQAVAEVEAHATGTAAFDDAQARFHRTIARTAGHDLYAAFTRWTLDVVQPSLADGIGSDVDAAEVISQYRAILTAISRGRQLEAEHAMRAHIRYLRTVVTVGN